MYSTVKYNADYSCETSSSDCSGPNVAWLYWLTHQTNITIYADEFVIWDEIEKSLNLRLNQLYTPH